MTAAVSEPSQARLLVQRLAAEPYRLLFAVGLLHVAAAMALWIPTALQGWNQPPIARLHLALVINGFQACFAAGFLATFAPRVMGAPATGPAWSFGLAALGVAAPVAILVGATGLLPWSLAAVHLAVAALLVRCVLAGQRLPPAPFIAVGVALGAALAADLVTLADAGSGLLPAWLLAAAEQIQLQGMVLLMVCGVAPIVLPRFAGATAGGPGGCPLATGRAGWLPWVASALIVASYPAAAAAEYGGWGFRAAWLARAMGAALLLRPAIHLPLRVPVYLNAGRVALVSIVLGLALVGLLPLHRIACQHLVFVTGFLWLTLVVAAKVLTAHGGAAPAYERSRVLVWTWSGLLVLANLTRLGAEFAPVTRNLHLWLAAVLGLGALVVWGVAYLGYLWRAPAPTVPRGPAVRRPIRPPVPLRGLPAGGG